MKHARLRSDEGSAFSAVLLRRDQYIHFPFRHERLFELATASSAGARSCLDRGMAAAAAGLPPCWQTCCSRLCLAYAPGRFVIKVAGRFWPRPFSTLL